MARPIWSGQLTFGLVSIPVGLHSAVEASEEVHFRLLHRKDLAPIRYKKFCSKEDVEVPASEIVRGYEVSKGKYSVVEGEELQRVQEELGEGDRTIELLQFVDFSSLNPLLFERPYYLTPQKGGDKPYAVLREALLETKRVGIARFYLRTRPLLAAVLPGPGGAGARRHARDRRAAQSEGAGRAEEGGPRARDQDGAHADRADGGRVRPHRAPQRVPQGAREAPRLEAALRARRGGGGGAAKKKGAKVVDLMGALKRSLEDAGKGRARGTRKRRAA